MIELPEAYALAKQIEAKLAGRTVSSIIARQSPHKFCWFSGDPDSYDSLLAGKTISNACYYGGYVELRLEILRLNVHDGVNLKYFEPGEALPEKHQLLVALDDGSAIVGRVQMYGGINVFADGELDNPYYTAAREKPDPLSDAFNREYFDSLLNADSVKKLSAKAFLATEQRILGLGNGVLQDMLWHAKINPKSKLTALSENDTNAMFDSVKNLLLKMAELGGRDTEKDLFGNSGGYITVMSKNNRAMTCPACGGFVKKEAYLGGSVYYCPDCQPLKK